MTSKTARERWDDGHYKQVNISVGKSLAEDYYALCAKEGVSVAGDLKSFMERRCGMAKRDTDAKAGKPSRGKRRKDVASAIMLLENVLADEEDYLARIPENFRGGVRADDAENSVGMLTEAISALEGAY